MLAKLENFTLEKTQFSPFFLFFSFKKTRSFIPQKITNWSGVHVALACVVWDLTNYWYIGPIGLW
jgi:hypothetical protein